jgi:hypothetical protein
VPAGHAVAWFAEAMRLWKRGPVTFALMALVIVVASIVAEPVPVASFIAANVVAPLLACGLLYGSLGADRDGRPRLRALIAVFAAPLSAQACVLVAAFFTFAVEALVAWSIAGLNLLQPVDDITKTPVEAILAIYAASVLATLPVIFVPMAALFDSEPLSRAFALSLRGFFLNLRPLLLLAMYSYALLMVGLATMGIGLLLAFPWISAASYSAWKDIFGLGEPVR